MSPSIFEGKARWKVEGDRVRGVSYGGEKEEADD